MNTRRETFHEPARDLPVFGRYDVVVAGGGIAGVASAVAAARNGATVCLLEKYCALGGLATLGNVTVWLPLCDGRGRQVIGGLPETLLALSVTDLRDPHPSARFTGIPACWQPGGDPGERARHRYLTRFNPASYLLALERFVLDAGVDLMYDTRVCGVTREADRLRGVIVENKDGRGGLLGRMIVDATGDAEICHWAGEPTESLDTNVPAGWFFTLENEKLVLNPMTNPYSPRAVKDDAEGPFFRGDDAADLTRHIVATRARILDRIDAQRATDPSRDVQPINVPTIACLRMTRRLAGSFSLGQSHMHQWFDDTVGLTGDWRRPGPVYAIPWRALCGVRNGNLLVAGRCISADTTVWDVTRAIPGCAVTGTAAGVGAALAAKHRSGRVASLAVSDVQARLKEQGALIDPALVAPLGDA